MTAPVTRLTSPLWGLTQVNAFWVVLMLFLLTVGELYLSPVGLSFVTQARAACGDGTAHSLRTSPACCVRAAEPEDVLRSLPLRSPPLPPAIACGRWRRRS